MHAFRCRSCGRLESADHAGQNHKPAACRGCGAGVTFNSSGGKTFDKDNWEVLAEATQQRLEELGITEGQVVRHEPSVEKVNAHSLQRATDARDQLLAKKAVFDPVGLLAKWKELDKELQKLNKVNLRSLDHGDVQTVQNAKDKTKQAMRDIENQEWTSRDEKHLAEVERVVSSGGAGPSRAPRSIFANALDEVGADDDSAGEQS